MPPEQETPDQEVEYINDATYSGIETAINQMSNIVHQNACDKGFYDNIKMAGNHVATAAANLHGEVSEFWESYRNGAFFERCDKSAAMERMGLGALSCSEEELADIIIRALDTAKFFNIDIGRAVVAKHKYNTTRTARHGGKLA